MGLRNYLIEGVSGTGKTTVCDALLRRGLHAIHGDRELAYQGDPQTGAPIEGAGHVHHIWDVEKVHGLIDDRSHPMTFFCGGSRNFSRFIDRFDTVFVLEVDRETLIRRLEARPPDEWGGRASERAFVLELHASRADVPREAVRIDATRPVEEVVDTLLAHLAE